MPGIQVCPSSAERPAAAGGGEEPVVKTVKAKEAKMLPTPWTRMFLGKHQAALPQPPAPRCRQRKIGPGRSGADPGLFPKGCQCPYEHTRCPLPRTTLEELLSVQEPLSRQPSWP